MRINRLDLTRYGKFTDASIDFGSAPVGSPDLHLIYGPNEAGKSTTLDAILDLIFGIGNTTKYGFLHPYATMRIGANIHVAGHDREFVRVKKQQNSLLDHHEKSLADAEIRADLGGIDREAFATMFSLDEETLVKGGESILASKGNLGELLFSASAGLSDLSRQLLAIRSDADSFYKYRSRSGALGELKARLAELKQEKEALDLQATDYQRLLSERDRLNRAYEQVVSERAGTQRRHDEIGRILRTLPSLSRLRALKERLNDLAVVPQPPPSWQKELPDLRRLEIEYRVKQQDTLRSLGALDKELAEIAPDPVALSLTLRMDELSERKARYLTAEKDIPKLSARAAELAIETILLQLGRPEERSPSRLLLGSATVGTFRELIGAKSGIDMRRSVASDELARIEQALAEQGEAANDLSANQIKAFGLLSATLKSIPQSDHEIALRSLVRRRGAAEALLSEALSALLPWSATASELASMSVPSAAKLQAWKIELRDAEEGARAAQIELDRLEPEFRRIDAEIGVVQRGIGDIDEASAVAALSSRDQAWLQHRKALDAQSADTFEAAMRANDHLIAQRLLHFSATGRLNQLLQRRATVIADIDTARIVRERALASGNEVRSDITGFWDQAASGSGLGSHPLEFEEWLRKRDVALKVRSEVNDAEQEIADLRDQLAKSSKLLVDAMANAGLRFDASADIATLVACAEEGLDNFHTAMNRVETVERLRKQRNERQQTLVNATRFADDWDRQWHAACEGCWLTEFETLPSVGAVTEILTTLEKLASALESRESLIDRVQKMEKDVAHFEALVAEFGEKLALPSFGSAIELAQSISDAVKLAGLHQERLEKRNGDLDAMREVQRELHLEQEILQKRIGVMIDFFGVNGFDEVEACIAVSARRGELSSLIDELEQELIEINTARDIDEVEASAAETDKDTLETELALLSPRLEACERRWNDLFHELSKAREALDGIGGDSKVAEIEEKRRTTLLEISEGARRYIEIRTGIAAAEHALRLYRDRHRSGMMARASDAFRLISRGNYQGVAAQPGKDGEVLIARSASDGSKLADELSKGARFQLYLALRVAGYHEFVANRQPVPFVADDIMESFDDFRAEEAFRLFAEMARHGQVVYLTHHRHLVDIARKACPGVRIHDLDEIVSSGRFDVLAAE